MFLLNISKVVYVFFFVICVNYKTHVPVLYGWRGGRGFMDLRLYWLK